MEFTFKLRDFLSFEETGEDDDCGFPVISVKFLGVEVERSVLTRWGTDIWDQDVEDVEEKAADVIRALWQSANEGENP